MNEHTATQTKIETSERSEWHRPQLRKLDAREAEGAAALTADGLGFS